MKQTKVSYEKEQDTIFIIKDGVGEGRIDLGGNIGFNSYIPTSVNDGNTTDKDYRAFEVFGMTQSGVIDEDTYSDLSPLLIKVLYKKNGEFIVKV